MRQFFARDELAQGERNSSGLTEGWLSGRLSQLLKSMAPPAKKKKLSYPDETEGSRLAAEIRRRANKMTPAQREECLKQAMQIYYGGKWPKEAPRSSV